MTTPDTKMLSAEPISLVEYRAERMLDALDCAAYIWMGEAQIPGMISNATSPAQNQKPVPEPFIDRMLEQVENIVHLAFVEGAFRSTEILDERVKQLRAERDSLTARVAELERERQFTCEAHRNEVRKGGSCVWCQLAAARAPVEESEIAATIAWLVEQAGTPCPEDRAAADLITRLARERAEVQNKALEAAAKIADTWATDFQRAHNGGPAAAIRALKGDA